MLRRQKRGEAKREDRRSGGTEASTESSVCTVQRTPQHIELDFFRGAHRRRRRRRSLGASCVPGECRAKVVLLAAKVETHKAKAVSWPRRQWNTQKRLCLGRGGSGEHRKVSVLVAAVVENTGKALSWPRRQWKNTRERLCLGRSGSGEHEGKALSWPRRQWKHTRERRCLGRSGSGEHTGKALSYLCATLTSAAHGEAAAFPNACAAEAASAPRHRPLKLSIPAHTKNTHLRYVVRRVSGGKWGESGVGLVGHRGTKEMTKPARIYLDVFSLVGRGRGLRARRCRWP